MLNDNLLEDTGHSESTHQVLPDWPIKLWNNKQALLVLVLVVAGFLVVSALQTLVLIQANMGVPAFIQAFQQGLALNFTEAPFTATLVTIVGFGSVILVSLTAGGLGWRVSLADFGLHQISWKSIRHAVMFGLLLAIGRMLALAPLISKMPKLEEGSEALLQMAFNTDSPLTIFASIALISVVVPIYEEALFRGFLHNWLRTRLKLWPAALVSAGIFAAFHLIPAQMLAAFVFGLGLAWYYEKTRSLWTVIVAHAVNNFLAQGLTYLALFFLQSHGSG